MKKIILIIMVMVMILIPGGRFTVIKGQENMDIDEIAQVYRGAFSKFLLEELDLEKYDEELASSDMNYIPMDEEHQSDAQKSDQLGLTYIYLRNEVHIERLTEEQQKILQNQDIDADYSDEIMQLICDTYVDVMGYKEIETEEDKQVKTAYDLTADPFFVTYDTILLRIATMREYDEKGNYVDLDHEKEKEAALEQYAQELQDELQGKLGATPIAVEPEM